jgi:hypothetical protein
VETEKKNEHYLVIPERAFKGLQPVVRVVENPLNPSPPDRTALSR